MLILWESFLRLGDAEGLYKPIDRRSMNEIRSVGFIHIVLSYHFRKCIQHGIADGVVVWIDYLAETETIVHRAKMLVIF